VPEGVAQSYQTLADETELFYQMPREYERLQPRACAGTPRRSRSNGRPPRNGSSRIATGAGPTAELVNLVKRGSRVLTLDLVAYRKQGHRADVG
jgi:hypothetical protein